MDNDRAFAVYMFALTAGVASIITTLLVLSIA